MKIKLHRIKHWVIPFIVSSLIVASMALFFFYQAHCYLEEDLVCYDKKAQQYELEENATLKIEVRDEAFGEALVKLWNEKHPEYRGALGYTLDGDGDILWDSAHAAGLAYPDTLVLQTDGMQFTKRQLEMDLNADGMRYLPLYGEGFAMIVNQTALEAMGFEWKDENKNNLHDDFETIDQMIELAGQQEEREVLNLSLNDPWVFYPYLMAYGSWLEDVWRLDQASVLKTLELIQKMSDVNWRHLEENKAEHYSWDYEHHLKEDNFVFSVVSPWMFLEYYDELHESSWQISVFPKADADQEHMSTYLYEMQGYRVKADVAYPSMAHEVIRLILSDEGLNLLVQDESFLPLLDAQMLDKLNFASKYQNGFALAYTEADYSPLNALDYARSVRVFDAFQEVKFMDIIRQVWDKEIDPYHAQLELAKRFDKWMMGHDARLEIPQNEPQ